MLNEKGSVMLRPYLKTARQDFRLTQNDVAKYLGMSECSYQRIELGTRGTSESNWLKLFSLFEGKVPLQKLMSIIQKPDCSRTEKVS